MNTYDYSHIVSFEETNLVGNVYYANHVKWQGRCREMFLYDHAPDVLEQMSQGLALVTVRVSCEYFAELFAFNHLSIRMQLQNCHQNRITMLFEYWRLDPDGDELVARGEQQVACMHRDGDHMTPVQIPKSLKAALEVYSS